MMISYITNPIRLRLLLHFAFILLFFQAADGQSASPAGTAAIQLHDRDGPSARLTDPVSERAPLTAGRGSEVRRYNLSLNFGLCVYAYIHTMLDINEYNTFKQITFFSVWLHITHIQTFINIDILNSSLLPLIELEKEICILKGWHGSAPAKEGRVSTQLNLPQ